MDELLAPSTTIDHTAHRRSSLRSLTIVLSVICILPLYTLQPYPHHQLTKRIIAANGGARFIFVFSPTERWLLFFKYDFGPSPTLKNEGRRDAGSRQALMGQPLGMRQCPEFCPTRLIHNSPTPPSHPFGDSKSAAVGWGESLLSPQRILLVVCHLLTSSGRARCCTGAGSS
jgi:hypothetical protein